MKKIDFLFDAIRSPYDIAHILQLALALDITIYTTGNCISFDNDKIVQKVRSWNISKLPKIVHNPSYEDAVTSLKLQGKHLIGTSPHATMNFYDLDMTDLNPVFVFGTESTGLTEKKQAFLDEMVRLPMSQDLDFMTLPLVISPIAYEAHRQFNADKPHRPTLTKLSKFGTNDPNVT